MEQLGDKADNIVQLFINFDPERDTFPLLKDYVSNFHRSILSLIGTAAETEVAIIAFQAFLKRRIRCW